MDVRMADGDGITATRAITSELAGTRVIVLTTFDQDDYVFDALEAGASGFLLKRARPEELLDAIQVVASGDAVLSPVVTRRVIDRLGPRRRTDAPAEIASLTGRDAMFSTRSPRACPMPRSLRRCASRSRRCEPTSNTSSRSSNSAIESTPSSTRTNTASAPTPDPQSPDGESGADGGVHR